MLAFAFASTFEATAAFGSSLTSPDRPETSRLLFGQQSRAGLHVTHQSLLELWSVLEEVLKLLFKSLDLQSVLIV